MGKMEAYVPPPPVETYAPPPPALTETPAANPPERPHVQGRMIRVPPSNP